MHDIAFITDKVISEKDEIVQVQSFYFPMDEFYKASIQISSKFSFKLQIISDQTLGNFLMTFTTNTIGLRIFKGIIKILEVYTLCLIRNAEHED